MEEQPWCGHCDDVIGVYEPMIVLAGREARVTSRLNEHGIVDGDCFHQGCFHASGRLPAVLASFPASYRPIAASCRALS